MTISTRLEAFVASVASFGIDTLTAAIRAACDKGEGFWLDPTDRGQQNRPCTIQHEVTLYGVTAFGAEPDEAARNWLKRAVLMLDAEKGIAA